MGRFNKANRLRGISYLKRNGVRKSIYKVAERLARDKEEAGYNEAAKKARASEAELLMQRKVAFANEYKISILVPVYETDNELLTKTVESVLGQTYGNWELCIADASPDDSRRMLIRNICEEWNLKCTDRFGNVYSKVKYEHLKNNGGISANTNEAFKLATGDYIALLDHDDLLELNAFYEFMNVVSGTKESSRELSRALVVYTDEDKTDKYESRFFDYHKKPDFDPVALCTNNYICHLLFVDANLARSVGGFRSQYDGAQDHDFILRCTEGIKREQVVHIPKVLYHWRSTESSTAENPNAKLYAYEAGKRAVGDHLKRMGIKADVTDTAHLGYYDIDYKRNDFDSKSVVTYTSEMLGKMTNTQIQIIPADYVLILSEKLRPVSKDYLDKMLSCMQLSSVGAVTGRIIGKGTKLESAGYDVAEDGKKIPRFAKLNRHFSGYMHRANTKQLVGGFSGECVLLKKDAVESFVPDIILKKGHDIFYDPDSEFKRKLI